MMRATVEKFWSRWVGQMDSYDRGALAALCGSSVWAGLCAICAPTPWVYFAGALVSMGAHVIFARIGRGGW